MASTPFQALVSLHGGHINKTPGEAFGRIEASSTWTAAELPLDALIDHIASGKAFVNALIDSSRKNENCLASNLIILDVDGDLTLEEFWAIPFAQRHCAFIYTSCSHLSDAKQQERGSRTNHSFRALFPAERVDLTTPEGQALYAERYHLLVERLGISLKDNSPAKPAQLWFGNDAAAFQLGQSIPLDWEFSADAADRLKAKAMARQQLQQQAAPRLDDDGLDEQRAVYLLDHLLRPSADGDFSGGYWVKVLNACAASGSDAVREAFLAWHSRGHHSKTQNGVARRYDKAGHRSGLGALFALAKEQHGSEWYKLLPPELQRKGQAPPQPKVLFSKPNPSHGLNVLDDVEPAPPLRLQKLKTDALSKEATEATDMLARQLYTANIPRGESDDRRNRGSSKQEADAMDSLLHQLYLLRAYGQQEINGKRETVPSHQHQQLDRQLLGAILDFKGYTNAPSEVERDLIGKLRWEIDLATNDFAPVKGTTLTGDPKEEVEWLVPDWILVDGTHVIYSKPGVGKTFLSIQIARAIIGDPSLNSFLDSGPINGHERWGSARVLYIASDMGTNAKRMMDTYVKRLELTRAPFLQYMTVWLQMKEQKTPAWQLSLRHIVQLYKYLENHQKAGTPVLAVIVDSMKAVCPDHLLVGQQAFKDYLRLVADICTHFDASIIWIHHASASTGGAQGISRITEAPDAVIKLELNQQRQVVADLEKVRGSERRQLLIDPFSPGAPKLLGVIDGPQMVGFDEPVLTNTERRMRDLLDILQRHFERYRQEHPEETGAQLALRYPGVGLKGLKDATRGSSDRTIQRDLQKLIDSGKAESKGHARATTYRVRLQENGERAEPYDAFTAGF